MATVTLSIIDEGRSVKDPGDTVSLTLEDNDNPRFDLGPEDMRTHTITILDVIEAEEFAPATSRITGTVPLDLPNMTRSVRSWQRLPPNPDSSDRPYPSNGFTDNFMCVLPDRTGGLNGVFPARGTINDDVRENSPYLLYPVTLPEGVIFSVWVKAWVLDGGDNSVYVGKNAMEGFEFVFDFGNRQEGSNVSQVNDITWKWVRNGNLTINASDQSLTVWAREDGFCFDQILLLPKGLIGDNPSADNIEELVSRGTSTTAQVAPSTRVLAAGYGVGSTAGPVSSTLPHQWPAAAFRRDPWWYDPWHLFAHQRTRLRPWLIRGAGSAGS
jgi:hypothetical protein